jgi:hypothetical protein
MTDMEILQIADQCGVVAVTKHEWDGRRFNHTDDYLDGDGAALVIFAKLVAQHEREACAKVCDDHCGWTPRMIGSTIRARGQA